VESHQNLQLNCRVSTHFDSLIAAWRHVRYGHCGSQAIECRSPTVIAAKGKLKSGAANALKFAKDQKLSHGKAQMLLGYITSHNLSVVFHQISSSGNG
jgi:hypothetical protein